MQGTLSAVPIKLGGINSGCLQKGGGGKVFSEKPVAFPLLGSCYTHPAIIYSTRMHTYFYDQCFKK